MKRRDALIGAAAGVSALVLAGRSSGEEQAPLLDSGSPATVSPAKLARISIMTYNFTSRLKLEGQPPGPNRVIELFDLPQWYVDTYGVHCIELQHSHFASTETGYLQQFRARIEKARSRMTQINAEFGPMNLSSPDPVQRHQAIDLTLRWVDHAVVLGCPRVMINQGALSKGTMANAKSALGLMNDYGKSRGVRITVETREPRGPGGAPPATSGDGLPVSTPGDPADWELVKELAESTGTLVNIDIGNIRAPDQASLHRVLKALLPLSSGNLHIKISPKWELGTAVRYLNNDLGYNGLYSIEVNPSLIRGVYETILTSI